MLEGGIELSYLEEGRVIAVDTLLPGSHLFSYSCLTDERIALTGVALRKTTILVLPYKTLEATRNVNTDFHEELLAIEEYLMDRGVPRCDFQNFRNVMLSPLTRFQKTVKKIIALQRITGKRLHFIDRIHKPKISYRQEHHVDKAINRITRHIVRFTLDPSRPEYLIPQALLEE